MNSSLYTADRTTHLKVVVIGLLFATVIAGLAIGARVANPGKDLFASQAPTVHVPVTGFAAGDSRAPMIR